MAEMNLANDSPISSPLKSIEELLKWDPKKVQSPRNHLFDPNNIVNISDVDRPRTILCHDMMNGYGDDKFDQGCSNFDSFNFWQWKDIDLFIYFSHYRVTIPPFVYRVICHRNRIPVLGTLIVEFKDGIPELKRLLNFETVQIATSNLVSIANHFQFDGWLLNIESPVPCSLMPILTVFVQNLTTSMRNSNQNSVVIWYDSIIQDGRVFYQNGLNNSNELFFKRSDGFFTNYNWTYAKIIATQSNCRSQRKYDVYLGLDLFKRDEKMTDPIFLDFCAERFRVLREFGMSAALFAIGYLYETTTPKSEFFPRFEKFWHTMKGLFNQHPTFSLPFKTNFCIGRGHSTSFLGKIVKSGDFTNLSAQQIQPIDISIPEGYDFSTAGIVHCESGLSYSYSFMGGSSYSIIYKILPCSDKTEPFYLRYRLFKADSCIKTTVVVALTYKFSSNDTSTSLAVELEFSDQLDRFILLEQRCKNPEFANKLQAITNSKCCYNFSEDEEYKNLLDGGHPSDPIWQRRFVVIPEELISESKLQSINLLLIPEKSKIEQYGQLWLGELAIFPFDHTFFNWKEIEIHGLVASNIKIEERQNLIFLTAALNWKLYASAEVLSSIESINILIKERPDETNYRFLGKTYMVEYYFMQAAISLPPPNNYEIKIQPVLISGIAMPLTQCPSHTINLR